MILLSVKEGGPAEGEQSSNPPSYGGVSKEAMEVTVASPWAPWENSQRISRHSRDKGINCLADKSNQSGCSTGGSLELSP